MHDIFHNVKFLLISTKFIIYLSLLSIIYNFCFWEDIIYNLWP